MAFWPLLAVTEASTARRRRSRASRETRWRQQGSTGIAHPTLDVGDRTSCDVNGAQGSGDKVLLLAGSKDGSLRGRSSYGRKRSEWNKQCGEGREAHGEV